MSSQVASSTTPSQHLFHDYRPGVELQFEGCLLLFLGNLDAPKWHASLNLFDSLTRIVTVVDPSSEPRFRNLLLRFLWEETSLRNIQSDLSALLVYSPLLRDHFAGFLHAPLKSRAQEHAARRYLCALTGLPASVSDTKMDK